MSMILEALRKSEAERQRGRAPGLFVEQRPAPAVDRRVPAWAGGLGALLLIVLVAWGWREWQRAAPAAADASPADTVVEAQPAQIAPRADDLPASTDAAAPITLGPGPAPAPVPPAPAPNESARGGDTPVASAGLEAPTAIAAAPAATPEAAGARAADAPAATALGPPPAEAPAWLPGLGTLAASERAALPPLKLSMHVFDDAPAQRFVILDGQRLGEGASPAAGVVLEEIRRDGLVLSVNGQRLLLARP